MFNEEDVKQIVDIGFSEEEVAIPSFLILTLN